MPNSGYYVELLTPRLDCEDFEGKLERFASRLARVVQLGHVVSVPDNPMGVPHFQFGEVAAELGLRVPPEQLLVHLNTLHTKADMDAVLTAAAEGGVRNLLVVTGDGSERLAKLAPEAIGAASHSVTSIELLRHVERAYPGRFELGVAFNPYEPQDHELEKMRRKVDAGARFVITQPVLGDDLRVRALATFGLPVVVGVWMSERLDLLSQCVGYELRDMGAYNPMAHLASLERIYAGSAFYLSLLSFAKHLPCLASTPCPTTAPAVPDPPLCGA